MTVRLSLALIVAVMGAGLIPSTVAADRPTEEEFSPVGDQFLCGGTLVTVQSGTILEREHVRELGSGFSHVVVIETPNDVMLMDEEGTAYRLVGTARGNFITAADPDAEFALQRGFFHFKVNLIGEGGLFGTVDSCSGGRRTARRSFGTRAAATLLENLWSEMPSVRRGVFLRALLSRSRRLREFMSTWSDVFGADLRLDPLELIDLGNRIVLLADVPTRAEALEAVGLLEGC